MGLRYDDISWEYAEPTDRTNANCIPCIFLQFKMTENRERVSKVLQVFSRQVCGTVIIMIISFHILPYKIIHYHKITSIIIYYRFIVRFPIGLDFFFITFTFLLHFFLSWTSSLSISSSAIPASTLSNHVSPGLPTGLPPSTLYSTHFFTQSSSPSPTTRPYHPSLPLLMKVVIGSTPTSPLNSSPVLLSFNEIPHIHLMLLATHSHDPC